jgi:3-dehydroquinate dehydratase/shikimate dehydrogenase
MGNDRESPLSADEIRAKYVFDMVYDPRETLLLKLARARGAETILGMEMFVHQAARQFEIWTGKPAPREEMLFVVDRALEERASARNGTGALKGEKQAVPAK